MADRERVVRLRRATADVGGRGRADEHRRSRSSANRPASADGRRASGAGCRAPGVGRQATGVRRQASGDGVSGAGRRAPGAGRELTTRQAGRVSADAHAGGRGSGGAGGGGRPDAEGTEGGQADQALLPVVLPVDRQGQQDDRQGRQDGRTAARNGSRAEGQRNGKAPDDGTAWASAAGAPTGRSRGLRGRGGTGRQGVAGRPGSGRRPRATARVRRPYRPTPLPAHRR